MKLKDVTKECKVLIENYSEENVNGLLLKHFDNRLMLIKLKSITRNKCFTLLWDSNKGYDIKIDKSGNFNVFYDENRSKICKECGHKKD